MPVVVDSSTPESERDLWRTHPALFRLLNDEFHFHVDAAASEENHLCPRYITREMNALKVPWVHRETGIWSVFCNPPFSLTNEFLAKGAKEVRNNGALCVFVIRADAPETGWFVDNLVNGPDDHYMADPRFDIRNLKPRVPYIKPDGKRSTRPQFPSAIVIMRPDWCQPPMAKGTVRWWWWKKEAVAKGYWE